MTETRRRIAALITATLVAVAGALALSTTSVVVDPANALILDDGAEEY